MELTVKQASRQSGLSTSHIARMLKAGRIKGRRENTLFGDVWYVDVESLAAYPATRQKPGRKTKQELQERQQEGASLTSVAHQQETVIDTPEGAHIRIDPLQPVGQDWLLAEATQDDMQATIQLRPYGTMASVWTLDKRYDRAESNAPGRMGRKQEQQGKALLALLEKHMRAALVAAGWHTEERAGNELWRYAGSEAREAYKLMEGAAHA